MLPTHTKPGAPSAASTTSDLKGQIEERDIEGKKVFIVLKSVKGF